MHRIRCPWCGLRDESEFAYGGDATVHRPAPEDDEAAWYDYVYTRDNPKGPHLEYWQHVGGCRAWLKVARDTVSHAITAVVPAAAEIEEADG